MAVFDQERTIKAMWIFDSNVSLLGVTDLGGRSVKVTAPVDIFGISSMSDDWAFSMAGGIWVEG
jgi:hypothetical protein